MNIITVEKIWNVIKNNIGIFSSFKKQKFTISGLPGCN